MSRTNLTVKVLFADGAAMLFGNSYRDWDDQLREFCCMWDAVQVPVSISGSSFPWVAYGGLKWCAPEGLQQSLDEEGKGRKSTDIVWGNLAANERSKFDKIVRQMRERHARKQLSVSWPGS